MSMNKCKALVKVKCQEGAPDYLMKRRGSNGSEVEMSEYFMPNNELSIEDKRKLFSIRNKNTCKFRVDKGGIFKSCPGVPNLRI